MNNEANNRVHRIDHAYVCNYYFTRRADCFGETVTSSLLRHLTP